MLKCLMVLACFASITQTLSPVPRQATNKATYCANAGEQQVENHQQDTVSLLVQDAIGPAGTQGKGDEKTPNEKQWHVIVDETPKKDGWEKFNIGMTAALTVIAAFTFGTVFYQTVQTRKAAEAARDSISLQEKGMDQWIVFRNWKVQPRPKNVDPGMFIVEFEIVNPTKFPLTIKGYTFTIGLGSNTQTTDVIERILMAPDVPYRIAIRFTPMMHNDIIYSQGNSASDEIKGNIFYDNCLGRHSEWPFCGMFFYSKTSTIFYQKHLPATGKQ